MQLINQFGDELAIGDTVVHSATDHVGKIKAVFRPTAQSAARRSQSAIRRFMIGMRLFKSATWPSIWLVHGSFSLSGLLTLETRLIPHSPDDALSCAVRTPIQI